MDDRAEWQRNRVKENEQESDEDEQEVEEEDEGEDELSSFIDDGDDISESADAGYGAYGKDDSEDSKPKKSKKKLRKKEAKQKKKKQKLKYESDEEIDELEDLMEGNPRRLHKNNKANREDDYEQYGLSGQEEIQDGINDGGVDYELGYEEEEEYSKVNLIDMRQEEEADLNEIFDPKEIDYELNDREIIDIDLPQRKIMRLINAKKVQGIPFEKVKDEYESEDRTAEVDWIYEKLRYSGFDTQKDERLCKDRIMKVLNCMHKEHLQIMYIYYYRKKVWGDVLDLDELCKIEEIDEQWVSFRKQYNKIYAKIFTVLQSFQEVPLGVEDSLRSCTELKILKYFKEYINFVFVKYSPGLDVKSNNRKNNIIRQICEKGINLWLEKKEIFLSPENLCINLRNKVQEKRPHTPSIQPDAAFRKLLRQNQKSNQRHKSEHIGEEEDENAHDWPNYPLLSPSKRIITLKNYLAMQLFSYPELRKILKEKYYKKLMMSTSPTVKGNQNINLYSQYFPVKRIKEKPVISLKKEIWVIAVEAEALGLITIQLKFEWELSSAEQKNFESDPVYVEMVKYYFDLNLHHSGQVWNLFRKQVLIKMLNDYFFPAFMEEVRDDLTREGNREIVRKCSEKFKMLLKNGPSLKENKPLKILAMVLEKESLGIAFVDEEGKSHAHLCIQIHNDEDLRRFVGDQLLYKYIQDHQPDMILVSANCRKAQTLRKQLRNESLFPQSIFCAFGEYQIPNLVANKMIIGGVSEQKSILIAISMARLKKNPMAEILSLWSTDIEENGVLSMNLHPLQKCVSKRVLADALERVAIEIVNLVSLDFNQVIGFEHLKNQLQFVCGLGPRKSYDLMEKVRREGNGMIVNRMELQHYLSPCVYRNCAPFLKVETQVHRTLLQRAEKDKYLSVSEEHVALLDLTRIPVQWYSTTKKLIVQAVRSTNFIELKQKKSMSRLSEDTICTLNMFMHPEKVRNIDWDNCKDEDPYFDRQLVKNEIMNRFSDPRDSERVMDNRDIFYNLLRESPDSLKKYMVVTAKILSANNQALNVVIPENGLFGRIKINDMKPEYEKGNFIKAVIIAFPFDERRNRDRPEDDQELLKVEMALNFPHRNDDRKHDSYPSMRSEERRHDCFQNCFPTLVKEIHPLIDLERGVFELRKQDRPIIEVKEQAPRPANNYRKISHPKFKNITLGTAIDQVRSLALGDFIIRPSNQGPDFLNITWHFYKNVVSHIKLKLQQKNLTGVNLVYIVMDRERESFETLDEVIERYIKPMNALVQDVISNKKFLTMPLEQSQERVKTEMNRDPSSIHYFFTTSVDYPQYFILIYIYRDKRPTKELIKVKSSGLYFHSEAFLNLRELIAWFKTHLKDREYQKYAKSTALKK